MVPKLTSIRAQGVRGLATVDLTLPTTRGAGEPLAVTGPCASGKTRLLEAIIAAKEACGGYGVHPAPRDWFTDPDRGSIELGWDVAGQDASRGSLTARWEPAAPKAAQSTQSPLKLALRAFDTSPASWKLEYLHATRHIDVGASSASAIEDLLTGNARVGQSSEKYAFVRAHLERSGVAAGIATTSALEERGLVLATDADDPHRGFAQVLGLLTDRLHWTGVRMRGGQPACLFARKTPSSHATVELCELSHAERMLVLYAATIDALGLACSLVLLDAPELHLPPEDQIRLIEGLRVALAGGQLIMATTSPAILRSLAVSQVVVLS
jgi:hypothetical protein